MLWQAADLSDVRHTGLFLHHVQAAEIGHQECFLSYSLLSLYSSFLVLSYSSSFPFFSCFPPAFIFLSFVSSPSFPFLLCYFLYISILSISCILSFPCWSFNLLPFPFLSLLYFSFLHVLSLPSFPFLLPDPWLKFSTTLPSNILVVLNNPCVCLRRCKVSVAKLELQSSRDLLPLVGMATGGWRDAWSWRSQCVFVCVTASSDMTIIVLIISWCIKSCSRTTAALHPVKAQLDYITFLL